YTVVIGVALTVALTTLIDPAKGLEGIGTSPVLLFFAFLFTLFPFYHGALRHLDDAYLENQNPNIKDAALIFDFILLFLHALVFVVLALLLHKPANFAWTLTVLMGMDVVWGIFVNFGSSTKTNELAPEARWAIINACFVLAALFFL